MKKLFFYLVLLFPNLISQAQNVSVSGFVQDAQSHERLIGAIVSDVTSHAVVATNEQGFYSLSSRKAMVELRISFVGYAPDTLRLTLKRDTVLVIYLNSNSTIGEVTVVGQSSRLTYNAVKIQASLLSKLPVLVGEPDVMKTLQLLPGVQSTSEGQSGFSIKGGDESENLILLDGIPVYNSNHLFGFLSIFNERAIQDITLYKGNFPAKYGGRLSSVVDLQTKEGNTSHLAGSASVGLLATSFDLEGPIYNDKTTFFISGRKSYLRLLAVPIIKHFSGYNAASYGFYDLNAKITHRLSDKSKLIFSLYSSHDEGSTKKTDSYSSSYVNQDESMSWGNLLGSFAWNYVVAPKLFLNTMVHYSKYDYLSTNANDQGAGDIYYTNAQNNYHSTIYDKGVSSNLTWFPSSRLTMRGGLNYTWQKYMPEVEASFTTYTTDGELPVMISNTLNNQNSTSREMVWYTDNDLQLKPWFILHGGVRYTMYQNSAVFQNLEPRINLESVIGKAKLSLSYMIAHQYNHLLTSSHISQATDLWVPSTRGFGPEKSEQYAVNLEYSLRQGLMFFTEIYYKTLQHLITYQEGSSYLTSDSWESMVTKGEGVSRGISFTLDKKVGRTTGWISYTLSKTTRRYDGINDGATYLYEYDHRHDFKAVVLHRFSSAVDVSCTWMYHSGNRVSFGTYMDQNLYVYVKRNAFQLPAYHRLDINANYHWKSGRFAHGITLGVYNAYNQKNIYNMEFEQNWAYSAADAPTYFILKKTLFPIIPSLTYRINFQ